MDGLRRCGRSLTSLTLAGTTSGTALVTSGLPVILARSSGSNDVSKVGISGVGRRPDCCPALTEGMGSGPASMLPVGPELENCDIAIVCGNPPMPTNPPLTDVATVAWPPGGGLLGGCIRRSLSSVGHSGGGGGGLPSSGGGSGGRGGGGSDGWGGRGGSFSDVLALAPLCQ